MACTDRYTLGKGALNVTCPARKDYRTGLLNSHRHKLNPITNFFFYFLSATSWFNDAGLRQREGNNLFVEVNFSTNYKEVLMHI